MRMNNILCFQNMETGEVHRANCLIEFSEITNLGPNAYLKLLAGNNQVKNWSSLKLYG